MRFERRFAQSFYHKSRDLDLRIELPTTAIWEIFLPFGLCDFKSPAICDLLFGALSPDRIMEAEGGCGCPTFCWAEMGVSSPLSKKSVPEFSDDEDGADVMQSAPENPSSTKNMTNLFGNILCDILFQN